MRRSHIALAALSLFLLACASGSKSGSASATTAPTPTPTPTTKAVKSKVKARSTDQSRLTSEEITAANLPTAYDLVDRLRRPWLRRDAVTGGEVVVYMDEQNIGGAEKLRDIPSVDVAELRYLPNEAAIKRWGSEIKGSVIVVTLRR